MIQDTEIRGYKIPKNTLITLNLVEVMNDPANFQNPDVFQPERFLSEDGSFRNHPAMVQYSIGKRDCPGKALAKTELFLFLANMIQQFSVEPSSIHELPSIKDVEISITRVPKPCFARFIVRN